LPEQSAQVPALRIKYQIRQGERNLGEMVVTRSQTRIVIRMGDDEWHFNQNAVDPRRAEGQRVLHQQRLILDYSESDLVDAGFGRDWGRLMGIGVDPEMLRAMQSTGQTDSKGIACESFVAADPSFAVQEICWNHEGWFPARLRIGSGKTSQLRIATEVSCDPDPRLTASAKSAWPDYAEMDLTDWREEDHAH
jgi:hypothetical protein